MKRTAHAPAVTSLPQAPQDEARIRVRNYWITMGVRMACFALTVLVTPYGWYTWVFALGAAVLPYVAVVFANAATPSDTAAAESPRQAIEQVQHSPDPAVDAPDVLTVRETREDDAP